MLFLCLFVFLFAVTDTLSLTHHLCPHAPIRGDSVSIKNSLFPRCNYFFSAERLFRHSEPSNKANVKCKQLTSFCNPSHSGYI